MIHNNTLFEPASSPTPDTRHPIPDTHPLRYAHHNPEELVKARVLEDMNKLRRSLLDYLRRAMIDLYLRREASVGRENAYVTADDARLVLEAIPNLPPPERLNRNFMGALFRECDGFEPTGSYAKSRTPGSHANNLTCWRVRAGVRP